GGWNYHIVDSMATEGPSGTSGGGGYTTNPWASAGMPLDARIQITHSPDRKKMFYSWGETDTLVTGTYWNDFPDLYMRGYDVTIDKVTPRVNVTGGVPNADKNGFLHMASNRSITTNTTTSTNEIPFTITYNSAYDGNSPVSHYYLKGASFTQADFTINPLRPVGVQNLAANTANYEVSNYPNPSNGSTTIQVSLKDAKPFELSIYTSVGQLIKTINVDGKVGSNEVNLDLSGLNAGVYMYSVKANNSVVTKKLIVQ
ncbi:MAG: T9SS type A sorting domain-containing protein, partial [Bacteroidia bacterium]